MTEVVDPNIARKSAVVVDALTLVAGLPLPSVVEISESGTCNRRCAFCPRSALGFPDIKEFIDPALIEKLAGSLGALSYRGIFLFSGFVEPMLDKNIFSLVARARRHLPTARIEMVTNGDVLNADRLRRLFDSGLSTLLISVYDGPEHAERFETLCRSAGLIAGQYIVRHRYLPPEEDFGIVLSNRAGMMENAEFRIATPAQPLRQACHYPHYTFFMDYLGDVLMCPHDWGKKLVVGNLKKEEFLTIWKGQLLAMARRRLAAGDRGFGPCKACDVKGALMGKEHVAAWDAFYAGSTFGGGGR